MNGLKKSAIITVAVVSGMVAFDMGGMTGILGPGSSQAFAAPARGQTADEIKEQLDEVTGKLRDARCRRPRETFLPSRRSHRRWTKARERVQELRKEHRTLWGKLAEARKKAERSEAVAELRKAAAEADQAVPDTVAEDPAVKQLEQNKKELEQAWREARKPKKPEAF